jgi:hypothetical protein
MVVNEASQITTFLVATPKCQLHLSERASTKIEKLEPRHNYPAFFPCIGVAPKYFHQNTIPKKVSTYNLALPS